MEQYKSKLIEHLENQNVHKRFDTLINKVRTKSFNIFDAKQYFLIDEEITRGMIAAENDIKAGHGHRDNLPFSSTSKALYQRIIYLKILAKHVNGYYNEKIIKKQEKERTLSLKAKIFL